MTWLRIDDCFAEHPKVQDLADRSFRLHVVAMCYCARNLTDGIITARSLRIIAAIVGTSRVTANVKQLVDAGLWLPLDDDAYEVKDFLDYNPPRATVKKKQAEISEKRRDAGRRGAQARWNGNADSKPDSKHGDNVVMAPSRPLPQEQKPSKTTPVENLREDTAARFFAYADELGFHGKPRLEALNLGPEFLEEAMRRVRSRGDVDNPAAYLTTVTRNLLAAQKAWRSSLPLEDRLLTYVKNVGWEYTDAELRDELRKKNVTDEGLVGRLVEYANELRRAVA